MLSTRNGLDRSGRPSAPKAAILGVSGARLTDDERALFAEHNPLGFILFARNCVEPSQIRDLTAELRDIVGRPDAPILIDQEGGRVQRLRPPTWRGAPAAELFGALYHRDRSAGLAAAELNARLMAEELIDLGINVDCAPVLDLRIEGAHSIIGDRAYDAAPEIVAELGRAVMQGLRAGGVVPIVKHIPGHGRAAVDSHLGLPTVDAPVAELAGSDFRSFQLLAAEPCWAMTAHICYSAIDPDETATTSRRVIAEVIRGQIGFDGVLVSDDVSMHALTGDFAQRTRRLFEAGCDLALHCNADFAEMRAVIEATPAISAATAARLDRAARGAHRMGDADHHALSAELAALLAPVRDIRSSV